MSSRANRTGRKQAGQQTLPGNAQGPAAVNRARALPNTNPQATADSLAQQFFNKKPVAKPIGHAKWPELPAGQGELFFECTLFLYSVLALFLQYLNLYKTLWWLPKSYWPTSLKYYMINPYLLSCIGLMLGVRVTKCFYNTITDIFFYITKGEEYVIFKSIEYGLLKTPICTMVTSSFVFSFTRVYVEHTSKAVFYFSVPLMAYFFLLWLGFDRIKDEDRVVLPYFSPTSIIAKISRPFCAALTLFFAIKRSNSLMDLDTVAHLCTLDPVQNRAEANALAKDFFLRLMYSFFVGFSTSYLSMYLPTVFLPYHTRYVQGIPQHLLLHHTWLMQIYTIVALTSFSVYFTYLLPLPYFDLLQRCAIHLGRWELLEGVGNEEQEQALPYVERNENGPIAYKHKAIVKHNNQYYQAVAAKSANSVSATPGDSTHYFFFRIANDPVKFITLLCMFETALIAFQFWMLVLTTDWQHIVTLVLLMFANYLLLGKLLKDRVVIGRIYKPSAEDLSLWRQMKTEREARQAAAASAQNGTPENAAS
uniref:Nucleoporin NDC1 n=1 Tax=Panagrellus redivivus TaxID=6233 RepID=A0A7E4USF4_PANRE